MNKEKIGEKLRELRGDLSREEVAVAVKVTANAIWMYENGKRCPTDEVKVRLANFYGTSVGDIFFQDESTDVDALFAPDHSA